MTTPAPTTTAAVITHLTATGYAGIGLAIAAAAACVALAGYGLLRAVKSRRR